MKLSRSYISEQNIKSESETKAVRPVFVGVGATSGVGQHTAYAFARHTTKPTVYIVGRNEEAAKKILSELKKINPDGKYSFLKYDLTSLKEAGKMAQEVKKYESKINVLQLSCGSYSMDGKKSAEGIEVKQALFFYSRWKIIDELVPLVSKAAAAKEPASINSILDVMRMGPTDSSNVVLEEAKKTGLFGSSLWSIRMTNLMVMKFSKMHPQIKFMNTHPGHVQSGIARDMPWYYRIPVQMLYMFVERPETSGERMHYINYVGTPGDDGSNAFLYDLTLKNMKKEYIEQEWLTQEQQDLAHAHFKDTLRAVNAL